MVVNLQERPNISWVLNQTEQLQPAGSVQETKIVWSWPCKPGGAPSVEFIIYQTCTISPRGVKRRTAYLQHVCHQGRTLWDPTPSSTQRSFDFRWGNRVDEIAHSSTLSLRNWLLLLFRSSSRLVIIATESLCSCYDSTHTLCARRPGGEMASPCVRDLNFFSLSVTILENISASVHQLWSYRNWSALIPTALSGDKWKGGLAMLNSAQAVQIGHNLWR